MAGLWQCLKAVDVSALCNLLGRCGRAAPLGHLPAAPRSSDTVCGYLQLTLIWHTSLAVRRATRGSIWNGFAQLAALTLFHVHLSLSSSSLNLGRVSFCRAAGDGVAARGPPGWPLCGCCCGLLAGVVVTPQVQL